ncbi:hypothetical protein KEH51_03290 [[Brevibacterium] frigoritolerans]|uniref:Uncharacterized protein n=1 Tax=Peribacillus frigoritolerans TaxID=450367 RepID=A0A941J618_9BACI|nr:hypothetical protein [Peribacillus frigoritolerans]
MKASHSRAGIPLTSKHIAIIQKYFKRIAGLVVAGAGLVEKYSEGQNKSTYTNQSLSNTMYRLAKSQ